MLKTIARGLILYCLTRCTNAQNFLLPKPVTPYLLPRPITRTPSVTTYDPKTIEVGKTGPLGAALRQQTVRRKTIVLIPNSFKFRGDNRRLNFNTGINEINARTLRTLIDKKIRLRKQGEFPTLDPYEGHFIYPGVDGSGDPVDITYRTIPFPYPNQQQFPSFPPDNIPNVKILNVNGDSGNFVPYVPNPTTLSGLLNLETNTPDSHRGDVQIDPSKGNAYIPYPDKLGLGNNPSVYVPGSNGMPVGIERMNSNMDIFSRKDDRPLDNGIVFTTNNDVKADSNQKVAVYYDGKVYRKVVKPQANRNVPKTQPNIQYRQKPLNNFLEYDYIASKRPSFDEIFNPVVPNTILPQHVLKHRNEYPRIRKAIPFPVPVVPRVPHYGNNIHGNLYPVQQPMPIIPAHHIPRPYCDPAFFRGNPLAKIFP